MAAEIEKAWSGGEIYTVPRICLGISVLVAPRDLDWESCSEVSVAWKAEAFSERKEGDEGREKGEDKLMKEFVQVE